MYKLVLSIIIPLFWWLARQLVFYLLQGLVIRLGLPSHRAKQLDQALGSLFGFFLVAVIWSFPGTLHSWSTQRPLVPYLSYSSHSGFLCFHLL